MSHDKAFFRHIPLLKQAQLYDTKCVAGVLELRTLYGLTCTNLPQTPRGQEESGDVLMLYKRSVRSIFDACSAKCVFDICIASVRRGFRICIASVRRGGARAADPRVHARPARGPHVDRWKAGEAVCRTRILAVAQQLFSTRAGARTASKTLQRPPPCRPGIR